jgi:hypothetical protein
MGHVTGERRDAAGGITLRPFDLDDISAQVCQHLGAEGTFLVGQIEHAVDAERPFLML